jgi:hypothetical protein
MTLLHIPCTPVFVKFCCFGGAGIDGVTATPQDHETSQAHVELEVKSARLVATSSCVQAPVALVLRRYSAD